MARKKVESVGTDNVETKEMGQTIDDLILVGKYARRNFERRWYDNNFFDDGHHFRFLQKSTNRIIDLSEKSTIYAPIRAIPKASRQIRGVANLILSNDPTPIIYPEHVSKANYPTLEQPDPKTGQMVERPNPEYEQALDEAKRIAKQSGHWVQEEFKEQDIMEKLALMVILSLKHGVSFLQVWPDDVEEKIRTQVFDAFDIYLAGSLTDIYDSPFIIKATPQLISQIKANENFDTEQLSRISPDNKYASSEVKDAYMTSRYGKTATSDTSATLILKEAFIKEYLNANNRKRIQMQDDGGDILKDKSDGDIVIRQVFTTATIPLRDRYVNLPDYPFVDFRMEPGPIYQVPMMERFIPANKSLDTVVSRLERYLHTMVTGSWTKRRGEQFKINNIAGGQVIEYDQTPPVQNQIAPIPSFPFDMIQLLTGFIEEQGVTTTTLGKLPKGVKSGVAIESIKQSEYANLVIASRRLKQSVKRITEKLLDLADNYFVTPQTVYALEKGEPQYFDIIGKNALDERKKLKIETPEGVVPISKDYKVNIEIESGLGYTKEGQRATMMELAEYLRDLAREGYLSPQAVKLVVEKLLETYHFGSTAEFMEAMEGFEGQDITDPQIQKMKVALLEVFKDLMDKGTMPDQKTRIQETKVGTAETIKDLGKAGGKK